MKELSKFTLGTAQLGLNYGIANKNGKPSLKNAFDILDKAVEMGIRSFDTAAAYGSSETVLGEYFANNKKILEESTITTKIVLGNEKINENKIEAAVFEKIDESLKRLKSDCVDNLMLHHVSDLQKYKEPVVKALEKAKKLGCVKKIGVSVYNTQDIQEMLMHGVFECVQLPINILDMRLIKDDMLKLLKKDFVTIYARSIFLQGLFFIKPENLPPKLKMAKVYLDNINDICSEIGCSVAELALVYARDIGELDSLVIGAETTKQIEENVRLMCASSIPKKYIKQINESFSNVPELYLEPWRWEDNQ